MSEFLHLAAVAPAGVAACCVVSGRARRRGRTVEIAVAVLMLAAMIDVSRSAPFLAPVLWAGLLLLGGLTLAATSGRRSGLAHTGSARPAFAHGTIHGALGCVVMAALVMVMVAPAPGASAGVASHHGASASVLTVVIGAGVLAYAAYSIAALRHGGLRERVQYAAMGASTLGMAAAVLA